MHWKKPHCRFNLTSLTAFLVFSGQQCCQLLLDNSFIDHLQLLNAFQGHQGAVANPSSYWLHPEKFIQFIRNQPFTPVGHVLYWRTSTNLQPAFFCVLQKYMKKSHEHGENLHRKADDPTVDFLVVRHDQSIWRLITDTSAHEGSQRWPHWTHVVLQSTPHHDVVVLHHAHMLFHHSIF